MHDLCIITSASGTQRPQQKRGGSGSRTQVEVGPAQLDKMLREMDPPLHGDSVRFFDAETSSSIGMSYCLLHCPTVLTCITSSYCTYTLHIHAAHTGQGLLVPRVEVLRWLYAIHSRPFSWKRMMDDASTQVYL
jgi:hypothetical protein